MPEVYFDERISRNYERYWPGLFEPAMIEPVVARLSALARSAPAQAGSGRALEFGIGTGRIALPLARRGIAVHGIELSPAMVARFREQPGAEDIGVTIGDFAAVGVDGTFSLVYLVRNTITNLTTQDEQVECFRNAARHLEVGGYFVIEVYIPALRWLPPGQDVRPLSVTPDHVGFEAYDVATQIAISSHYWTIDGQVETFSAPFRYVWPAELDLMARLAGMKLRGRWSGWQQEPFTSESTTHVSVWEKITERVVSS
jgi:SAM-dependent methyltransferase